MKGIRQSPTANLRLGNVFDRQTVRSSVMIPISPVVSSVFAKTFSNPASGFNLWEARKAGRWYG
jgi:hypothetical protein